MILQVFTDGAARGNPGMAAIGFVIKKENGQTLDKFSETIGCATNNTAEYRAVIEALEWVRDHKDSSPINYRDITINFFIDSELVVQQLNGLFKVKKPALKEYVLNIRMLEQEIVYPISYQSIPREQNAEADRLVNQALDDARSG